MKKPVVAITRPADRARKACEIVERLGGDYILAPTLNLQPINSDSLKGLIEKKDSLDWIIFTSPTTIDALDLFYPEFLKNLTCNIAVIGNKTGKQAEKYGLNVDLIPADFTGEGLLEEFKNRNITNQTIGIPRTASARLTLPEGLKKLGNAVILAEAYKSLPPSDNTQINKLIAKIKNNEVDAITFTSPLTVKNFFKIAKNKKILNNILVVAIGPITGNVLDNYNINYIYPNTYTVLDMMELLFETWRKSNGR